MDKENRQEQHFCEKCARERDTVEEASRAKKKDQTFLLSLKKPAPDRYLFTQLIIKRIVQRQHLLGKNGR
tara:strand:+ start:403 stop:612 length:210 start_codon:yes stop_codon:yes gene_type:complete